MRRSSPQCSRPPVHLLAFCLVVGLSPTLAAQPVADAEQPPEAPQQESNQAAARVPQEARQGADDDVDSLIARGGAFSASVEMVRVPVIVVDGNGSFVQDLTSDDFAVRDGRRDHPVAHFVSDAEPVIVGVLVDASVEMRPWGDDARIAVERIAGNLRADDELFLISYGSEVDVLHEPTADKEALLATLPDYATGDSRDRVLYDAIGRGLSSLRASSIQKRSLIVVGTGGDTASDLGELSARQLISLAGVTIHTIAMSPRDAATMPATSRVGRLRTLPEIASFTAGFVARPPRQARRYGGITGWSATAGTDLTTYLKHQYLLHYAPENPPTPGTWRAIRVKVAGDHREIRARSGYTR